MWYVLQTMTGKEKEAAQMIKRIVPSNLYEDCFVAYYERVWRKQQQSIIHVERLFPGYVFIISDVANELFQQLKKVPAMVRLMSDGCFTFLALEQDEVDFFENMLGANHIIQLSYIEKDGKDNIRRVEGPLKNYVNQVTKIQYKKRYVILKLKLLGVDKTIALGIILKEDIRQEIVYGKVEMPLYVPAAYDPVEPDEKEQLAVGDQIKVISGTLEHMTGVIWRVKKYTVEIGVRLFGQDMAMEIPKENICKASDNNCYGK